MLPPPARKLVLSFSATVCLLLMLDSLAPAQTTGGRILGRVADPSGAVIAGVKVHLINEQTGASRETQTNGAGDYQLPDVAIGMYRLEFASPGFKKTVRRGVTLEVNQVVTLNVAMQLGRAEQVIEVTSEAPLVDTTSTHLGAVVNQRAVSQLPLNARDTYQLLQLQPGVQSQLGSDLFYGSDQSGVVSVNGGRGRSNNYMVNGGDANDQFVNLPAVQPSPDSIQEFRVLTNTFDAEYGRNSGSVVNVVTKSGTNQLHGSLYEFFRNKVLNARGFFDPEKPDFKQNQFGGTLGGPIAKDRTFFFVSYEGRRIRRGTPSGLVNVPTLAERNGDFSADSVFSGNIADANFASMLNSRPGCAVAVAAEGGTPIAAGASYSAIFPSNRIPSQCFDPTAFDLMNQFVSLPNRGANQFLSVPVSRTRADQFTFRIDHKINERQQFSAYYYFDDDDIFNAFSFFQAAGANVPGFGGLFGDRFQQWNLSHAWVLNNTTVNEFRFSYFREGQETFNHPAHTNLVQNSCVAVPPNQCFSDPNDPRLGITPGLGPNREGVPFIMVSGGFNIGNNFEGELPQTGNTFQWSDTLSKVVGKHSLKFGADLRRQRFDQLILFDVDGEYFYFGGGLNDVATDNFFPDYLLGLPDEFLQSAAEPENLRSTSAYLFGQDSWKIRPNLTLNYGLRWEVNTPYADLQKKLQAFHPGQATSIFPCQLVGNNPTSQFLIGQFGTTNCNPGSPGQSVFPLGMVFPGDKGVPGAGAQTYYRSFAPRIGLAWSPNWDSAFLRKLTGGPGKTSIHTGWGIFYNPIEQLVLEQGGGAPCCGIITLTSTLFNTPFEGQDGTVHPNPFGGIRTAPPNQPVDFSVFRPITLFGVIPANRRSQYAEQYNLTIERELKKDLVLNVGYVGSQGHRLLASHDLNPGNAQSCLDIISVLGPGACFPFGADTFYTIPAGAIPPGFVFHLPYGSVPTVTGPNPNPIVLPGLRPFSAPFCQPTTGAGCPPDGLEVFTSIFTQDTIANSNYNSLQASVEKRFAKGLQFLAAYTFSKSIDQASSFENILNPLDFRRSRALSLFNAAHRFVLSYYWEFPVPKFSGAKGKLLNGWATSGILTFQSGFPIRITSSSDLELENSFDFELPGQPDLVGKFKTQDPRNSGCAFGTGPEAGSGAPPCQPVPNQYFDPNVFANQALGTIGNAQRSICCGPGINNFDIAFLKDTPVNERAKLQFRAEFFNIFNHAQFFEPDGNITDGPTFGQVSRARDPRLVQLALKLLF